MSKCKQQKVKNGRIRCSLSSPGSKPEVFPLTFIKGQYSSEIPWASIARNCAGFGAMSNEWPTIRSRVC